MGREGFQHRVNGGGLWDGAKVMWPDFHCGVVISVEASSASSFGAAIWRHG